jgi:hypothetical protein
MDDDSSFVDEPMSFEESNSGFFDFELAYLLDE